MITTAAPRIDGTEDRALEARIRRHLERLRIASLRRISVTAEQGTVTLRGQLGSFYEKQLALSACQQQPALAGLIDCVGVAID